MKQILHTRLNLGITTPVKILHVTDLHITQALPEDGKKGLDFAELRRKEFGELGHQPEFTPQEYLKKAFALAEAEGAFPVLGGDIIDCSSFGNREALKALLTGKDFLYTPGSHEFQIGFSDALSFPGPYYEDCKAGLEAAIGRSLDSDNRILGEINLVTLDNSLDLFTDSAREKLEKELARGLPILLFTHVPLICGTLRTPRPESYRVSQEQYRRHLDTIERISSSPLIKASFGGHWHSEHEDLSYNPPTYVTPGAFEGIVRMIEIY